MTTFRPKPQITGSIHLDLVTTDPDGHAAAVSALTVLPYGARVRVIVGHHTKHDLDSRLPEFFAGIACTGIHLHFDGTADALDSWLPAVRGIAQRIPDNVDPLRLVRLQ